MKKKSPSARYSNCKFTNWLLAACFLTSSAIATTANSQATPTILAINQGNPGNIIVDGSRVYWIDSATARVASVDKLNGGLVLVNSPAAAADTGANAAVDIVQDTSFLYFLRLENCGDSIYKASKISYSFSRIVDEQAEGNSLGISNGTLYFPSFKQWENNPQQWDG